MLGFQPTLLTSSSRASMLMMMTAAKRHLGTHPEAIHRIRWHTFKANMLSDPSVYPLLGIMGFALIFMAGMGTHALLTYQDVEIDKKKRASTIRYWGGENNNNNEPLTKSLVYWNSWQKNNPEGLGIDHKKWLESKNKKE